jgi:hypothetical protein
MHARLDQLLSLRDGAPVDAEVRLHVQHCAVCLADSARLAQTRDRLRALPAIEPTRDFWSDIEARAAASPPRRRVGAGVGIAAATVFVVVLGYIGVRDDRNESQRAANDPTPSTTVASVSSDEIERLIAQSRELEAVLAYLPERPHVERVSTAATVDSLEQRIQWLDWQLANGSDAGLDRRQAQRLWSERVDLMDSLVKVRYAESAPMVF